jgi:hypothetical protein
MSLITCFHGRGREQPFRWSLFPLIYEISFATQAPFERNSPERPVPKEGKVKVVRLDRRSQLPVWICGMNRGFKT